jgi:hypothetical protein
MFVDILGSPALGFWEKITKGFALQSVTIIRMKNFMRWSRKGIVVRNLLLQFRLLVAI